MDVISGAQPGLSVFNMGRDSDFTVSLFAMKVRPFLQCCKISQDTAQKKVDDRSLPSVQDLGYLTVVYYFSIASNSC